jgi:amidase
LICINIFSPEPIRVRFRTRNPDMSAWKELVDAKRRSNFEKIPKEWRLSEDLLQKVHSNPNANVLDIPVTCGILTPKEIDITGAPDATTLLQKLANGDLSAYEVTLAFCKRAAIAQQLINCLTEIFFDQALERAKALDDHFTNHGKPMGALHGLPISLKVP